MAEIASTDLLADIIRQITDNPKFTLTKASTDLNQAILQSSYMLS